MKTFQLFELSVRIEPMQAFFSNLPVPRRPVRLLIATALVGLMVLTLGGVSPASAAATILVDDDADGPLLNLAGDGKCQLREAIEAANTNVSVDACVHGGSPGLDTINFDLQGVAPSGPSVINLYAPLIVTEPVVIDGTSDPEWPVSAAPTIEINGGDNGFDGFILETGSDGSSIMGFQLMDFTGNVDDPPAAIRIKSSGNFIRANYIGTDGSNSVSKGNDYGVYVAGSHNTIGGSGPAEGNLIAVNSIAGVYLVGAAATGNTVEGNMMGTFPDGTTGGLGNKVAVLIDGASSNLIGGTATIGLCGMANPAGSVCNVITSSNNSPVDPGGAGAGVRIIQSGANIPTSNLIQGNYIGLGADGKSTWGNYYGVHIRAGSHNWVGGLLSGQGNTISANSYGIYLDDPLATALLATTVARNKIGLSGDGLSGLGNLGSGIYVYGTSDTIIGNTLGYVGGNLISGNGSGATDAGITVADAVNLQILGNRMGLDVESNSLPNKANAIYIADGIASATVKIYGNRISNHAFGILDDDPEALLISGSTMNCITGNSMGYDNTSGSTLPRPFSSNWWGDPTGPFNATTNPAGLGDAVSDNVTYLKFLTAAPTTCDPLAPTLKKPKNGSGIYVPKAVVFGWKRPREQVANYFLQIDDDPAFTSLEVDDGSGKGVDVTLMKNYAWSNAPMGKYYWRIKAISPEGFMDYSPVWTFYVTILSSPKNNAIVKDTTPIFKWKLFPLALNYDLKVGTSPTCGTSTVITVSDWVDRSYTDLMNALTPGAYYWCVQPDNGPETPVYTFTIPAPAP